MSVKIGEHNRSCMNTAKAVIAVSRLIYIYQIMNRYCMKKGVGRIHLCLPALSDF